MFRPPQRLRLLSVTVASSTGLPATAEVTLELGQGPAMRREHETLRAEREHVLNELVT